ncbi:MAG: hypothetical protein ACQKBV_01310 [Puniceicoccales bacterium]
MDSTEQAYRKIDARLRAHGVKRMSIRHRVTEAILEEARALEPTESLERRANRRLEHRLASITGAIRDVAGLPDNATGRSRALLLLSTIDEELAWLGDPQKPDIFAAIGTQVTDQQITTGPKLTRSALGAPQIDFGLIEETTENTLAVLNKWPKLRFAGFLLLLGSITAFVVTFAR